jgi:hypothetical protein
MSSMFEAIALGFFGAGFIVMAHVLEAYRARADSSAVATCKEILQVRGEAS